MKFNDLPEVDRTEAVAHFSGELGYPGSLIKFEIMSLNPEVQKEGNTWIFADQGEYVLFCGWLQFSGI